MEWSNMVNCHIIPPQIKKPNRAHCTQYDIINKEGIRFSKNTACGLEQLQ